MPTNAPTPAPVTSTSDNDTSMNDLVSCLKIEIERNGQFSASLNDMARGYAAGKGVSFPEARNAIKDSFFQMNKQSPKEYLDSVFDQKPQYAQTKSQQHSGGRGR